MNTLASNRKLREWIGDRLDVKEMKPDDLKSIGVEPPIFPHPDCVLLVCPFKDPVTGRTAVGMTILSGALYRNAPKEIVDTIIRNDVVRVLLKLFDQAGRTARDFFERVN